MEALFKRLASKIRGWINYFAIASMTGHMNKVDQMLRVRVRAKFWKLWKKPSMRQKELQKLGIDQDMARRTAYWGNHYMLVAHCKCINKALSNKELKNRGLVSCAEYYRTQHSKKLQALMS